MCPGFSSDSEQMEQWTSTAKLRRIETLLASVTEPSSFPTFIRENDSIQDERIAASAPTGVPKKRTASAPVPPQRCFVKELAGETPPSFPAMERLYGLASDLYGLRPWRVLDEDNLIVVRDSVSSELCYCSVKRHVHTIDVALATRQSLPIQSAQANSRCPKR